METAVSTSSQDKQADASTERDSCLADDAQDGLGALSTSRDVGLQPQAEAAATGRAPEEALQTLSTHSIWRPKVLADADSTPCS